MFKLAKIWKQGTLTVYIYVRIKHTDIYSHYIYVHIPCSVWIWMCRAIVELVTDLCTSWPYVPLAVDMDDKNNTRTYIV